ncbi:MAG TPA: dienelactone hydrolase family protein [Xanthobacteraceae bacterium]
MKERLIEIAMASGAMDTFIACPSDPGTYAAVIIYMDVWGLREELFDIARRVAAVGYYCAVPNFYYRQGKIRHEFRNDRNRMITLDRLDEQTRKRVLAPLRQLTDAMVIEDTATLLAFIDADPAARNGAPLGCIGYCMGGRHAFRVTGHYPTRFLASASLHGTDLVAAVDSPHLSVLKARGEVYCGFGERDRHTPTATVDTLARTLPTNGVRYRYEVHKGAEHGYALPDRDVYDKQSANRDWEIIFPMLHRRLRPCSMQEASPPPIAQK